MSVIDAKKRSWSKRFRDALAKSAVEKNIYTETFALFKRRMATDAAGKSRNLQLCSEVEIETAFVSESHAERGAD